MEGMTASLFRNWSFPVSLLNKQTIMWLVVYEGTSASFWRALPVPSRSSIGGLRLDWVEVRSSTSIRASSVGYVESVTD